MYGDTELTLSYMRESMQDYSRDEEVSKGLKIFEQYIGQINFIHPGVKIKTIKNPKRYIAIDTETGDELYSSATQKEMAQLLNTTATYVNNSVLNRRLINDRIKVIRGSMK